MDKLSDANYRIRHNSHGRRFQVVHFDRLKPYEARQTPKTTPEEATHPMGRSQPTVEASLMDNSGEGLAEGNDPWNVSNSPPPELTNTEATTRHGRMRTVKVVGIL